MYYRREYNHKKLQQRLDCQPGSYYIPNPTPLASGRLSLKSWWAKQWYETWHSNFNSQQLTSLRSRAREDFFASICVSDGYVRAVELMHAYYEYSSWKPVELKFQAWDEKQISTITDYLIHHPLEAVRLLDGHLTNKLNQFIEREMIPLITDDWLTNQNKAYVYYEITLAYILLQMIDRDAKWLFIIHGFSIDRLYAILGEEIAFKQKLEEIRAEANVSLFWVSKDITPQLVSQRQPLLSSHLSGLPNDFQEAIRNATKQLKNASQKILRSVQRPTWEPKPLFDDHFALPAMPDLTMSQVERLEAITELTDEFYSQLYQDELQELNLMTNRLVGLALASLNCNFIYKGYPKTWACAVATLLTKDLEAACEMFDVSVNTTPNRVKKLRQGLGIGSQDRRWMTPQQWAEDPRSKMWQSSHGLIVIRS
jgi:uncharacterized Zn finger protein